MSRSFLCAIILVAQSLSISTTFAAGTDEAPKSSLTDDCAALLASTLLADESGEDGSANRTEEDLAVLAERRPLISILDKDPAKNLAVQAPFMVMNAAQRVGVLGRSHGISSVRIPGIPQEIMVYNVVSDGINGQRIVGQERSVEALFETVDAQANGDRAAASVPLHIGSHGSGKSAVMDVLREAFYQGTAKKDSPYAVWTFEWVGLDQIPQARYLQPKVDETRGVLKAVQDDSPILLLPPSARDQVVKFARSAVLKITNGKQEPMPFLELNPQDKEIRNAVLLFYREKEGRDLTNTEVIAILNKHTRLRRVIWDSSSGALPVIDAQGEDTDTAGILLSVNPVIRVTRNAADTFAWEPGKALRGHGNAVFWDEILRNPKDFLRLLLRIFQERKVSIGGSPDFPLDAVFLAASNTATLNELLQDPNMHALVDRFLMLEMPWTTNPNEIGQILLHNYSKRLQMQPLPGIYNPTQDLGPLEAADMARIYPRNAVPGETGPDYRYKLVIPMGDREVKFSPHAIRFMSYIIAATRMVTDTAKAKEVMPFSKIIASQVFRDPITRIRFEEGLLPDITNGEVEDIRKLARLLDEGSEGIASRDAGRWMSRVVAEAQRPENRNTVTPDLAFKVFQEMLGKKIKVPDNKTRLQWQGQAMRVATQLIVPYIEQDVNLAMAADQASIRSAYYEMIDEMRAIYNNPRATVFRVSATNEDKAIDRERLSEVQKIFQSSQGKRLDVAQIAMFHDSFRATNKGEADTMHPGLITAISQYYARITSRLVSISSLAKYAQSGDGDAEVRTQFQTVVRNLMRLGYDEGSAIAALRFKGRIESLTAQALEDRQP